MSMTPRTLACAVLALTWAVASCEDSVTPEESMAV